MSESKPLEDVLGEMKSDRLRDLASDILFELENRASPQLTMSVIRAHYEEHGSWNRGRRASSLAKHMLRMNKNKMEAPSSDSETQENLLKISSDLKNYSLDDLWHEITQRVAVDKRVDEIQQPTERNCSRKIATYTCDFCRGEYCAKDMIWTVVPGSDIEMIVCKECLSYAYKLVHSDFGFPLKCFLSKEEILAMQKKLEDDLNTGNYEGGEG